MKHDAAVHPVYICIRLRFSVSLDFKRAAVLLEFREIRLTAVLLRAARSALFQEMECVLLAKAEV